jgi:hypothetical protein
LKYGEERVIELKTSSEDNDSSPKDSENTPEAELSKESELIDNKENEVEMIEVKFRDSQMKSILSNGKRLQQQ